MRADVMKSTAKGGAFLPALIFALFSFFFSVSCAAVYAQDEGRQAICFEPAKRAPQRWFSMEKGRSAFLRIPK